MYWIRLIQKTLSFKPSDALGWPGGHGGVVFGQAEAVAAFFVVVDFGWDFVLKYCRVEQNGVLGVDGFVFGGVE